mmetsp:Transcript_5160/g.10297  ORF Transcript_5160/g.10297 Transcript_5160/m.10297 type:complete len:227 (-) Transcript_5160:385-1065(-)
MRPRKDRSGICEFHGHPLCAPLPPAPCENGLGGKAHHRSVAPRGEAVVPTEVRQCEGREGLGGPERPKQGVRLKEGLATKSSGHFIASLPVVRDQEILREAAGALEELPVLPRLIAAALRPVSPLEILLQRGQLQSFFSLPFFALHHKARRLRDGLHLQIATRGVVGIGSDEGLVDFLLPLAPLCDECPCELSASILVPQGMKSGTCLHAATQLKRESDRVAERQA